MKKIYFIPGSQDLYGEECLRQVAADCKEMVDFLNGKLKDTIQFELLPTVETSEICVEDMKKAVCDDDCVGVCVWMHTFSPAKMWIKGLQILNKPLLHLHTQANEKLPYETIDMDFMNLNQAAHGDREFGYILARLNIPHQVVAGFYKHDKFIAKVKQFAEVAKAIDFSYHMRVATFGNNMRDVAVTDGNRLSCEIKYGWEIKYWGIGEIADLAEQVTDAEIADKMAEYNSKYEMATDRVKVVEEQARYEVAFEKFLKENGCSAFTDSFQDLHGLDQLPGIAAQNMMAKGIGFGPEGDYKIAAFQAVLEKMSEGRKGATGFMEDYTYDLTPGEEVELASHMLEVPAQLAANKPRIEVHPLGIGGKSDPARLVFDCVQGDGIQVTLIDLGDHFRIVCADVELIKEPHPMPNLPVAHIMYRHKPNFEIGTAAWCYAGGAHHSVISTALNRSDIALFAKLTGTELVTIGDDTTEAELEKFYAK